MIAETSGMLRESDGLSPMGCFTMGVLSETADGTHLSDEYPGTSRYSLKVWDVFS
jgi:hypothetical protein